MEVGGAEPITENFSSPKFFQPRRDSASDIDPEITPENALSQISITRSATGIPINALKKLVNIKVARNKETFVPVFAQDYLNVLPHLNVELVKQYTEVFTHEVSAKSRP